MRKEVVWEIVIISSECFPPAAAQFNNDNVRSGHDFQTGKHYHRTSFIIQAFNHKFRLILELNTPLIAPNVLQKHIFSGSAEQRERNELEMCYYHGNVEGLEWSAAAVRTCNGLSGIIHMGNETFIIHPFYGGDMSVSKNTSTLLSLAPIPFYLL
jgi:hypothetical protein